MYEIDSKMENLDLPAIVHYVTTATNSLQPPNK